MPHSPSKLKMPVGDVIKRWREFFGWGLTEYAEKTGLSKGYVSSVENGRVFEPRQDQLAKLAVPFGITDMDLMTRKMPDEHADQGDKPDGSRSLRLGAGFQVRPETESSEILKAGPGDRIDQLEDILRRLHELEEIVETLLEAERVGGTEGAT